jgi:hypothetical protein
MRAQIANAFGITRGEDRKFFRGVFVSLSRQRAKKRAAIEKEFVGLMTW